MPREHLGLFIAIRQPVSQYHLSLDQHDKLLKAHDMLSISHRMILKEHHMLSRAHRMLSRERNTLQKAHRMLLMVYKIPDRFSLIFRLRWDD